MKRFLTVLALLASSILLFSTGAEAGQEQFIEVLPAITSESSAPNRIWAGAFQLVWNELVDEILKKPVKFAGCNSEAAKALNRKTFKKSDVSDSSYYIKSGIVSLDLKTEIETALKEKFNETSDILDSFDWSENPENIFIYAMLKKDFKYIIPFDKLPSGSFGNNYTDIEYFGIDENSSRNLRKNVSIMFYNADNDFAVKLYTKSKDIILLYRTDDDKTFDKYYEDIDEKSLTYYGSRNFTKDDKLRIPDLNLYLETNFPELEGRRIKGTNYFIGKTAETVKFKMDNEGVKLKNEAALMIMKTMHIAAGRNFNFCDKYILFLIEKGKQTPYYAMRVNDAEIFNKTWKKE